MEPELKVRSGVRIEDNVTIRVYSAEDIDAARRFLGAEATDANLLTLLEAYSKPVEEIRAHNRIVDVGLKALRDLIVYPVALPAGTPQLSLPGMTPDFMAVGTSGAIVTAGDVALGAEVFRKSITQKLIDSASLAGGVWKLFLDTTEANGNTLREAGLYDLASGNANARLWGRVTYADWVKTSSGGLTITWTLTVAAG